MELFFPDLIKLKPTVLSTVLKATEEYGELSREVHNISNSKDNQKELQKNIPIILEELLDVAQTMFTLIYFMQKTNMMSSNFLEERLETHVSKLANKGYLDSSLKMDNQYKIGSRENGDMFIILPRCNKIVFSSVETGILLNNFFNKTLSFGLFKSLDFYGIFTGITIFHAGFFISNTISRLNVISFASARTGSNASINS